jgi:hypothetical protein
MCTAPVSVNLDQVERFVGTKLKASGEWVDPLQPSLENSANFINFLFNTPLKKNCFAFYLCNSIVK